MNTLCPAPDPIRYGTATFNGEEIYSGPMSRAIVATLNANFPAVGLRIKSVLLDSTETPPFLGFAEEGDKPKSPPVKQKPHLRIVK